jgi:hypothetical protein
VPAIVSDVTAAAERVRDGDHRISCSAAATFRVSRNAWKRHPRSWPKLARHGRNALTRNFGSAPPNRANHVARVARNLLRRVLEAQSRPPCTALHGDHEFAPSDGEDFRDGCGQLWDIAQRSVPTGSGRRHPLRRLVGCRGDARSPGRRRGCIFLAADLPGDPRRDVKGKSARIQADSESPPVFCPRISCASSSITLLTLPRCRAVSSARGRRRARSLDADELNGVRFERRWQGCHRLRTRARSSTTHSIPARRSRASFEAIARHVAMPMPRCEPPPIPCSGPHPSLPPILSSTAASTAGFPWSYDFHG